LEGRGGGTLALTVPVETDLAWGDVIVYPQFSSRIIGMVYYIDTESQTSLKTAYVRVPSNVFSTKWIWVDAIDTPLQ
jgi:hypothetical protein